MVFGTCFLLLATSCGDATRTPQQTAPTLADHVAFAVSSIIVGQEKHGRTEGAARSRAWRLWRLVRDGTPFGRVAAESSDAESKHDNGFLGFVPVTHDTALAGALQTLAPGTMSLPVRTSVGYQILFRHTFEEGRALERKYWLPIYAVFLPWSEERSKDKTRVLAERLLAQLRAGETTLLDVRKQYVRSSRLPPNCFLGATANRGARRPLFEAVSSVPEGGYVGPVETPQGWALLRRGHQLRAVVQHIVVKDSTIDLSFPRTPAQAKALADELLKKLHADPERWPDLVKNHSDHDESRPDDGLLNTVAAGSMPLEFEKLVRETPAGQISKRTARTRYGWHIIRRLK